MVRGMGVVNIAVQDALAHPMPFTDACALGAFVLGLIFCAAGCVSRGSGPLSHLRQAINVTPLGSSAHR